MRDKERLNGLTREIIRSAPAVHRELGPGMLESTYTACLMFELLQSGFKVEREKPLPLTYRGHRLDCGYRIDLLVEDEIIVEVKSIERLDPVHGAQLLSYLRLSKLKVGPLINFNVQWLTRDGVRRIVNAFPD
jgi:GxxExxY protein